MPNATLEETKAYRSNDQIEILSNTEAIQAVRHKQLLQVQANFYQAGKLKIGNGLEITIDGPGLLLIHLDGNKIVKMAVADPSRKLSKIHLQVNGKVTIKSPHLHTNWNAESWVSDLTVKLPEGGFAGSSVILGD